MSVNPARTSLTAAEATARLHISRRSLYVYVSRGLIRSWTDPDHPSRRRYDAADVTRFLTRKSHARRPTAAARDALTWGHPVLTTDISSIHRGVLRYRGVPIDDLSSTATLEECASLLWSAPTEVWTSPAATPNATDIVAPSAPLLDRVIHTLLHLQRTWPATIVPASEEWWIHAARLMRTIAASIASSEPTAHAIHDVLADAWSLHDEQRDVVRTALVLCADHELSASTFAARTAASTKATLPAALIAAVATFSGPRHGGMLTRIADSLQHETPVPAAAFDHPLYPHGDPRARMLLRRFTPDPHIATILADPTNSRHPSIDIALIAFQRAYALPPDAALAIFLQSRLTGWIAHITEQHDNPLIRPRATPTP